MYSRKRKNRISQRIKPLVQQADQLPENTSNVVTYNEQQKHIREPTTYGIRLRSEIPVAFGEKEPGKSLPRQGDIFVA